MKKFTTWLESRDPAMSKAIQEASWLHKMASLGALGATGLGGYHSFEPAIQKGMPALVGKQYPGQHTHASASLPHDMMHSPHATDAPRHGGDSHSGHGPDPDGHGHGHGPDPDDHGHGDHGHISHGHDDHGHGDHHGHDHSDHLMAHLYGDKEKERDEDDQEQFYNLQNWARSGEAYQWLRDNGGNYNANDVKKLAHHISHKYGEVDDVSLFQMLQQFASDMKKKVFQKSVSTLPSRKDIKAELPQSSNSDENDDFDFTVPPEVRMPGGKWRPGINPITPGQAQYQQMRAGQSPSVQADPFDFSGKSAEEPVNPQIAKFAKWMQNKRR